MSHLAPTLKSFFTTYLSGQRGASAHTVAAYRDTWRLLLAYLGDHRHRRPAAADFTDLDAETVSGFLTYLETVRGNSPATRNARLAASHAFFGYSAYQHPEHADLIRRVLAIRAKNAPKTQISYRTDAEVDALLAAPPEARWVGKSDRLIILTLITTGLTDLRTHTPYMGRSPAGPPGARCLPRQRPQRADHAAGRRHGPGPGPAGLVRGKPVTGSRVRCLHRPRQQPADDNRRDRTTALRPYESCGHHLPNAGNKTVTPHVLRHTNAMRRLAAGIDTTTISLWLGH
ncbi:site-specific integrase [Arthrobacter sp. H20]|uniref:tyrosine-type recombinase/integrase n=1 Tax=Arthrobacter sp. H20 TaxID=1267981 RepID=UPI0004B55AC3|nr:site-specific integrase [Arthrobacter sp. H20]